MKAKLGPAVVHPTTEQMESTNLQHIVDAPDGFVDPAVTAEKERQKAAKKRYKKLRQRMLARGSEFETHNSMSTSASTSTSSSSSSLAAASKNKGKIVKATRDIQRLLDGQQKGVWPAQKIQALDKSLGELTRLFDINGAASAAGKAASSSESASPTEVFKDQLALASLGGLQQLFRIFVLVCDSSASSSMAGSSSSSSSTSAISSSSGGLPNKTIVHASNVVRGAARGCFDNANGILLTNKISVLIDVLSKHLKLLVPDTVDVHSSPSTFSSTSLSSLSGSKASSGPAAGDVVVNSLLLTLTVLIEALQAGHGGSNGNAGGGGGGGAGGKGGGGGADFKSKFGVDEAAYASYTQDVVSYVISTGVVDKLNVILFHVTLEKAAETGDEATLVNSSVDADVGDFLTRILGFLTALTQLLMLRMDKEKKHEGDPETAAGPTFLLLGFCSREISFLPP